MSRAQTRDAQYWREAFLAFFEGKGCKRIASESLVASDPTTLFTSAGMQQFKDDFTGNLRHGTRQATSSQKCLRFSDLESVGRTQRHHTFFEMLGFFSFGAFFKEEAIRWIWEFYTSPQYCALPVDRLRVSVFKDDDEAYELWKRFQPHLHDRGWIYRLGERDNFWPAGCPTEGPNGVCGPCSEIFFDCGEVYGADDLARNDTRFMEIGNIVFTQFDRSGPVPGKGTLTPLAQKNIDFGGGFERLVMAIEGVATTSDSSLFLPIRMRLRELGLECGSGWDHRDAESLVREKRIADHARAAVFCIADGVVPSTDRQGYILRRIIRRAFRDGRKLGMHGPFLHRLVETIASMYREAYPAVGIHAGLIAETIVREEEDFDRVLARGLSLLDAEIERMLAAQEEQLSGARAFDLHSTHGLPIDVTRDVLVERGLSVDVASFHAEEEAFRARSRAASGFGGELFARGWLSELKDRAAATEFLGYEVDRSEATVLGICVNDALVASLADEGDAVLVLDRTPFYGESGGQVGDNGYITSGQTQFLVLDTQRKDGYVLHIGRLLSGSLSQGSRVAAVIDIKRRDRIRIHHSATHLMHSALRRVLGEHVHQKGSVVDDGRLRFDFSHPRKVSDDELRSIERLVNAFIRDNHAVRTDLTTPARAQQAGALMFFGEKYGEEVRMLSMGDASVELCGGTHVARTGDIGLFRIVAESSVSSGVRRIEAVCGEEALERSQHERHLLASLELALKTTADGLPGRVGQLLDEIKQLKSEKGRRGATHTSASGAIPGETLHGVRSVIHHVPGASMDDLLTIKDRLMQDGSAELVLLAGDSGEKASMLLAFSQPLVNRGMDAGPLLRDIVTVIGGRGGGKKHLAQAGGTDASKIGDALSKGRELLSSAVSGLEAR